MSSEKIYKKWGQFISFNFGFLLALPMTYNTCFQKGFMLSQVQSQLVAWAFYVAYFGINYFLLGIIKS
jgi:FHS family L-fucose permease-like MFS transporter